MPGYFLGGWNSDSTQNNKWEDGIPIPPKIALGELELTHPKDKNNKNKSGCTGHLPAS
jgi:hypothetical protein